MSSHNIIVGLDVGTGSCRTIVAQKKPSGGKPQILAAGISPSSGLRKGVIVDVEEAGEAASSSLLEAEGELGIKIKNVFVNVGGGHITVLPSKGVVAVSRADGEISEEDIERAIKASQTFSLPANREIIHAIPKVFCVDEESSIKDPLGMKGVRLEVESLLVLASSPFLKNLFNCLSLRGLEIENYAVSILAASQAVLTKHQKELGVAILDFGASTTDLAIFEEGDLLHLATLPVGSSHITNDIAIGLRIPIDLAEKIKIRYGYSFASEINRKEVIDISKVSPEEKGVFPRKELVEIIEARVCEIFDLVNKELRKIGMAQLLPAGVVLVGGGSKLPGIVELCKREFSLPCHVGYPRENLGGLVDQIDDPSWAVAAGLVILGFNEKEAGKSFVHPSISGPLGKLKNLFRSFLP